MSADFIIALDAQIDAEERDLSANPAFNRWLELKKIRALYKASRTPPVAAPATHVPYPPEHPRDPSNVNAMTWTAARGKRRSRHAETVATVKAWLVGGQTLPTQEIMDRLAELGTVIDGKNPRNSMHSILFHAGIFESMGRAGWRLKDAQNEKAADAVFPSQEAPAASSEPRLTSEGVSLWGHVERQQPPGGGG